MLFRTISLYGSLLCIAAPTAFAQAALTRVSGTVFDSLAAAPLSGALVQLVGADDRARVRFTYTDARGRFLFDTVAPGVYLAGALHPRFDSLLVRPPVRAVTLRAGQTTQVTLAVPSARALQAGFCAGSGRDSTVATLIGRLQQASDTHGAVTGRVRVTWREFIIDAGGARPTELHVETSTNDDGAFAICGLPRGGAMVVQAWAGADSLRALPLVLPVQAVVRQDLRIATGSRGNVGMLRGTVRGVGGAPAAGVRVSVLPSGVEAITDAAGAFTLRALAAGTQLLETHAVGFEPTRTAVQVSEDGLDALFDLRLEPLGREIDKVRVNASRIPLADQWLAGFEERRKLGFGHFVDEATVEKLNPQRATDLLRATPGVRVTPKRKHPTEMDIVFTRHLSNGGYCTPDIFVDGMLLHNTDGTDINLVVSPRDVRSMEVYTSGVGRPAQFSTANGCGTIVIWRGMRKLPP